MSADGLQESDLRLSSQDDELVRVAVKEGKPLTVTSYNEDTVIEFAYLPKGLGKDPENPCYRLRRFKMDGAPGNGAPVLGSMRVDQRVSSVSEWDKVDKIWKGAVPDSDMTFTAPITTKESTRVAKVGRVVGVMKGLLMSPKCLWPENHDRMFDFLQKSIPAEAFDVTSQAKSDFADFMNPVQIRARGS